MEAGGPRRYVGVVGPGSDSATREDVACARRLGALLAQRHVVVICGGLGGVMEAVCEGARSVDGMTVGLLPGDRRQDGNPHLTIALPTGLGELRNGLLVRASEAIVSIGRSWGTLNEVALALRQGRRVVLLHSWDEEEVRSLASLTRPDLVRAAHSAEEAAAITWASLTSTEEPRTTG
jgi:uncharacterized protein (TIGR00725 family)